MKVSFYFPSILLSENKPKVVRFKVLTSSNLLQIIVPALELCPGKGWKGRRLFSWGRIMMHSEGKRGPVEKQNLTAALRAVLCPLPMTPSWVHLGQEGWGVVECRPM